jgi:hypothetical protein
MVGEAGLQVPLISLNNSGLTFENRPIENESVSSALASPFLPQSHFI